uniref:Uncharacterized protein n=1 Tax=Anguilla anguilla TaxID=7936 RepID=A0A0E9X3U2_ANGAN
MVQLANLLRTGLLFHRLESHIITSLYTSLLSQQHCNLLKCMFCKNTDKLSKCKKPTSYIYI